MSDSSGLRRFPHRHYGDAAYLVSVVLVVTAVWSTSLTGVVGPAAALAV